MQQSIVNRNIHVIKQGKNIIRQYISFKPLIAGISDIYWRQNDLEKQMSFHEQTASMTYEYAADDLNCWIPVSECDNQLPDTNEYVN